MILQAHPIGKLFAHILPMQLQAWTEESMYKHGYISTHHES